MSSSRKRASLTGKSPLDSLFKAEEESLELDEEKQPIPEEVEAVATPAPKLKLTSINLYDDQNDWLDDMALKLRKSSGNPKLRKASFIRALIDVGRLAENHIDLADIQSEEELQQRLISAIRAS